MARRVLDTNVLIYHWLDMSRSRRIRDITVKMATKWGLELTNLHDADVILTPIYLEYVCGQGSAHEVRLARAYLLPFEIIDGGEILRKDWENAKRIAERVPKDGLRRQMGDCLIRAICDRLHLGFVTFERRFPHRVPEGS